jgi:rSAM/selenodomain-associated transferase 1
MTRSPITFQLFAKAPVPGRVKTRLHPALSFADAATLHARLVARTAAALDAARDALPEAGFELWCAPDTSDPELRSIALRHRLELRAQRGADLGARMRDALAEAMPAMAILVGSDCPLVDATLLLRAAEALLETDAVFVPAEDGGYALVGCRGRVPGCFAGIAWSTAEVMRQTRERLRADKVRWVELPVAWDVDTPADLARVAADVRFSQLLSGLTVHATAGADQTIRTTL